MIYGNIKNIQELKNLAETGADVVGVTDRGDLYTFRNNQALKISKDEAKELLGLNESEIIQVIASRGNISKEELKGETSQEEEVIETSQEEAVEAPQEEESELEKLKKEYKALRELLEVQREQIDKQQEEIERLTELLEDLKDELRTAKEQHEENASALEELKEEAFTLKNELKNLK